MKHLLIFIFLPICGKAQIITTYAGGGGSICENCAATTTAILDPSGSVFDKNGNCIFTSGLGGNTVRKIDPTGIVTTIAGTATSGFGGDGGPANLALLNTPESVGLDKDGNLYIGDLNNYRIRKISATTGIISTVGGIGTSGYNGDGIPASTAQFRPVDILVDPIGNIFIADYDARRVRKIDLGGLIHTVAGKGTIGYSGDGGPATLAELSPAGIARDKTGNIYVADPYANVVRKIDPTGIITTVAGNGNWVYMVDDIPATDAQIQPNRVAVDRFNNLYISDNFNKRIFRVNNLGIINCVGGNGIGAHTGDGGPATAASLDNNVAQLSLDSCGNLYVSETSGRIRKISFNPDCLPISVKDVKGNEAINITLHPNPATETLTITAGVEIETLTIVNAIGQCVVRRAGSGERQLPVNVAGLPPGVYMVRVNETWVGKFVKE